MFELDKNLANDTFFVSDLKNCRLLLMNNANFLWLILVPRIVGAVELIDISIETQTEILQEINLVAKIMQKKFLPHKLNIATLGNVVRQLHIHIVARFVDDVAFPKPVWGSEIKKYNENESSDLILQIKEELLKFEQESDNKIKQLLYRSIHRGCKETDFLIGEFAKKKIHFFGPQELKLFADFIIEDDMLIYDWVLMKREIPQNYKKMVKDIREFHKIV